MEELQSDFMKGAKWSACIQQILCVRANIEQVQRFSRCLKKMFGGQNSYNMHAAGAGETATIALYIIMNLFYRGGETP